ncbi:MAG: hypothetical protein KDE27_03605 [Planctomycetes bacterium]|nr:hypothetical protein [Planctomycetota bacterium]
MNPSLRLAATIVAGLGLALSSTAQGDLPNGVPTTGPSPAESPLPVATPLIPIHTGEADSGHEYGTWAAGARYKASFHDGATFVPYLGRGYPVRQALRWRTASATIGGHELANRAPTFGHGAFRAEFDLGDIIEAYDVRPEGLEQTFVIASKPNVLGDLVIRGLLDTDLVADERGPAHDEIRFRDAAGNAILSYGAATAIDAAGSRLPMTSSYDNGTIELRLDGQWLAGARFPLVVDPLLGVIYSAYGDAIESVDVTHDPGGSSGNVWCAMSRWVTVSNCDAFLVRMDEDGSNVTTVWSDLSASWCSGEVSLGRNQRSGAVLLAFTRDFSVSGNRGLRVHRHLRGDFGLSTSASIVTTPGQVQRPDVSSDLSGFAQASLMVVYQQEIAPTFTETNTSEIWAVEIDISTGSSPGVPFKIRGDFANDCERPSIGKVRGLSTSDYTVAYQICGNNPVLNTHTDWDVQMCRIDASGFVSPATTIGLQDDWHEMSPMVAGFNDTQYLAFTLTSEAVGGFKTANPAGMRIRTAVYQWSGSDFVPLYPYDDHVPNNDARSILTGFDFDSRTDSHAVMSFRSTVTQNLYARSLGYRGHALRQHTVYAPAGTDTTVSGGVAYDYANRQFYIAYGSDLGGGAGRVEIERFVHEPQIPPVTSGVGCSTAQIDWVGTTLIGDEGSAVRLTGLPSGALATVFVGLQPFSQLLTGTPFVEPGCWLLVPNTGPTSLGQLPIAFGPTASYAFDLPEWLDPMTLYFQGVHFNAAGNQVQTTQRLTVSIVK